jgi:hypothetical protein
MSETNGITYKSIAIFGFDKNTSPFDDLTNFRVVSCATIDDGAQQKIVLKAWSNNGNSLGGTTINLEPPDSTVKTSLVA